MLSPTTVVKQATKLLPTAMMQAAKKSFVDDIRGIVRLKALTNNDAPNSDHRNPFVAQKASIGPISRTDVICHIGQPGRMVIGASETKRSKAAAKTAH